MPTRPHHAPTDRNTFETSARFWSRLHGEFEFDIDTFASDANAKLPLYFTKERSAFDHPWTWSAFPQVDKARQRRRPQPRTFGNPPYSQTILGPAVERTFQQSRDYGLLSVMLIPPSTDAAWWHDVVMRYASEIRFVRGRLQFEYLGQPITVIDERDRVRQGSNRGASCVVVFRPGVYGPTFSSMPAELEIAA